MKSEATSEFSARSRFTNRKFPFVCYGSLGHIFIHVHFSSLWICEKVKWCLTSNFRCIFFIVVVIKMVCSFYRVSHIEMNETKWLWGVKKSIILLDYGPNWLQERLFWKLVDETQMPTTCQATRHYSSKNIDIYIYNPQSHLVSFILL